MENASEAIIMAGSVMLLLIALTISISSLANLKNQTQSILDSRDQVDTSQDTSGNYINYITTDSGEDVRSVGVDGIISELRRMKKENFTIYIIPNAETSLDGKFSYPTKFGKLVVTLKKEQKYKDENNTDQELTAPGTKAIKLAMTDQDILFYYFDSASMTQPISEVNRELVYELYNKFSEATFKEYIGIYQEKTAEGVSDANKETKKIITFVQN